MSKVAELLGEKGISAAPVVDDGGAPIGMVSEGDLIGREETERETRRDWWLTLLAEGEQLHPDLPAIAGASGARSHVDARSHRRRANQHQRNCAIVDGLPDKASAGGQ
jgi:CBS domain protein